MYIGLCRAPLGYIPSGDTETPEGGKCRESGDFPEKPENPENDPPPRGGGGGVPLYKRLEMTLSGRGENSRRG
jgi:hypothetical protein